MVVANIHGLLGCHPEKMPAKLACSIVQRSFSGPVWKQESRGAKVGYDAVTFMHGLYQCTNF